MAEKKSEEITPEDVGDDDPIDDPDDADAVDLEDADMTTKAAQAEKVQRTWKSAKDEYEGKTRRY